MNKIKDEFIQNLIKELNEINEDRVHYGKNPLDVCFMVASVDQNIEQFKEFIEDISKSTYYISGYEEISNTRGINISIEEFEHENGCITYFEYYYHIEFDCDERLWGHCQCESTEKGYNEVHKCCGNGCDWASPAFRLTKITNIGYGGWDGQEKDYWKYQEQFNKNEANKNEEVEVFKKQQKIDRINSEIKRLQDELKNT